ncbi:hypothetical protein FB565_004332 [Actinoplanes lutulentus]|uniref:DUF4259 domain-containing protein n=1 Tax=Actinoplanes lutulentus TaxID=1287878 RepID=UPI0015ECC8BA|nr:DUF4259 domain-containing protein [Actinoplanes lutulentus]MBB2944599.1 hypothetical protein [Actinoplanes lutulentus]
MSLFAKTSRCTICPVTCGEVLADLRTMATWHFGPFDNDDAVDWCSRLESAIGAARAAIVRDAMTVVTTQRTGFSDAEASEALAAAATVLQVMSGKADSRSGYAPRFLLETQDVAGTPELRALAVAALDAIVADGSPWRTRWMHDVEEDDAIDAVERMRSALDVGEC